MPKCPKCKKKIDWLKEYVPGENYYMLSLGIDRKPIREEQEFWKDDWDESDYECPYCSVIIFKGEEKAIKFLKGDKK